MGAPHPGHVGVASSCQSNGGNTKDLLLLSIHFVTVPALDRQTKLVKQYLALHASRADD